VCDRCNHEVLSPLDAALCDFGPIAMMRTIHGVPSKSGNMPAFKFDNGRLSCRTPGELFLELDSGKWHEDGKPASPGRSAWSFTAKRHDMTPKRLSKLHRALVKLAVEYAWLDLGEERLLSDEFARERDIVLHGGHRGYVVMRRKGDADTSLRFEYRDMRRAADDHPLLAMAAAFWGVPLITDSLFPEPPAKVPPALATVHPF
jgi:hypothetical protein